MILVIHACFYIYNEVHQKDRIDNCLKQSQLKRKRKRKMRGKNNVKIVQHYKYMLWSSAMLFTISQQTLSLNIFNFVIKENKERKMMVVLVKYVLVIVMTLILRVLYDSIWCYYLTPRRIKKLMERQGITGPKPRLLTGNIIDISKMVSYSVSDHCSSIHHNIVPRLLPHYVAWSKQYGTYRSKVSDHHVYD